MATQLNGSLKSDLKAALNGLKKVGEWSKSCGAKIIIGCYAITYYTFNYAVREALPPHSLHLPSWYPSMSGAQRLKISDTSHPGRIKKTASRAALFIAAILLLKIHGRSCEAFTVYLFLFTGSCCFFTRSATVASGSILLIATSTLFENPETIISLPLINAS